MKNADKDKPFGEQTTVNKILIVAVCSVLGAIALLLAGAAVGLAYRVLVGAWS